MLIFTANQGREIIESLYPPLGTELGPADIIRSPCLQTLLHHGQPRIIQEVDVSALVEIASNRGYTIELIASIGDAALESTPLLRVFGVGSPIPENSLRSAMR